MTDSRGRTDPAVMSSSATRLLALGRLAGWVAHEINNPLAGIKNVSALLRRSGHNDGDRERYAGIIDREVERIVHVLHSLHDALACPASAPSFALVRDVVDDAIRALPVSNAHAAIVLTLPDAATRVDVPPAILRLVTSTVLRRAVSVSRPDGTVRVHARRDATAFVLSIETADEARVAPTGDAFLWNEPAESTGRDRPFTPDLGLRVARDVLQIFEGSLTIEGTATGRLYTSCWPSHHSFEDLYHAG